MNGLPPPFGPGRTELEIRGLETGEYEVQVRAFVDNTAADAPEEYQTVVYGICGESRTVIVP